MIKGVRKEQLNSVTAPAIQATLQRLFPASSCSVVVTVPDFGINREVFELIKISLVLVRKSVRCLKHCAAPKRVMVNTY